MFISFVFYDGSGQYAYLAAGRIESKKEGRGAWVYRGLGEGSTCVHKKED